MIIPPDSQNRHDLLEAVRPNYIAVLLQLVRASPRSILGRLLLISIGFAWLSVLMHPSHPDADNPFEFYAYIAIFLAFSPMMIAVAAEPVGAVLLAEMGRPRFGFWRLVRTTWISTFFQLFTVMAVFVGTLMTLAQLGLYLEANFGASRDAVESIFWEWADVLVSVATAIFAITSILSVIDVQIYGKTTIIRVIALIARAPFLAIIAMSLSLIFVKIIHLILIYALLKFLIFRINIIYYGIIIASIVWCSTICVAAYYRCAFASGESR